MKPEIAKKWCDALLSGEYLPGKDNILLKTKNNEFHVIGVLCDLYRKETGEGEWVANPEKPDEPGYWFKTFWNDKDWFENTNLPPKVLAWSGIQYEMAGYNTPNDYKKVADIVSRNVEAM